MHMRYLLIVILITVSVSKFSFSQIVKPWKVSSPTLDMKIEESDIVRDIKYDPWIVYSDRSDNITYIHYDKRNKSKTLKFMEQFFVKDFRSDNLGGMIRIYKADVKSGNTGTYEDYGWIEINKMLISQSGLMKDPVSKINIKCMLLNKQEVLDGGVDVTFNLVPFYYNPDLTDNSNITRNLFEILYVYKQIGNSYLLGSDPKTSIRKSTILGWVDISRIVLWNNRIVAEPNCDPKAVSERQRKSIKAVILSNENDANKFKRLGVAPDNLVWDKDTYERKNANWRRFPVLSMDDGIISLGCMGNLVNKNNDMILDQDENAEATGLITHDRNLLRKINLVFVIDGTKSMATVFQPVINALNSSIISINKKYFGSNNLNKIRFAAVIYRDAADKELGQDIEICRLGSSNDVIEFLSKVQVGGIDNDYPEAVNYGLQNGIRSTGIKQGETNLIVLIGDAGNHKRNDYTNISSTKIKELFKLYDCKSLTIQVNRPANHNTYEEFTSQIAEIISASNTERYNPTMHTGKQPKVSYPNSRTIIIEHPVLFGKVIRPEKGQSLSESEIQNAVEEIVTYSDEWVEKMISCIDESKQTSIETEKMTEKYKEPVTTINEKEEEVDPFTNDYSNALSDFLLNSVSPEMYKKISSEKFQFYYDGYAPISIKNLSQPLFEQMLFMNQDEFYNLRDEVVRLTTANTEHDFRQHLYDTWKEILKSHLGENSYENKTMEEMQKQVYELPSTSKMLSELKLEDILVESKLPIAELHKYRSELFDKLDYINDIRDNGEKMGLKFSSNDVDYYWVPQRLIP